MNYWVRNDQTGIWDFKAFEMPTVEKVLTTGSAMPISTNSDIASKVAPSLVHIKFNIPYVVDGGPTDNFVGCGLILSAEKGLVLVDQNTVPLSIGDLTINFGGTFEVNGKVVYLHPIHNFSVVQYDPQLLKNSSFKSVTFSNKKVQQGDSVYLVGMAKAVQLFCQSTVVSRIEELFVMEAKPPRFRATNEETIQLEKFNTSLGGVLVDENGAVQAIWASYSTTEKKGTSVELFRAFPVDLISDILAPLLQDQKPRIRSLETELWPTQLSFARDVGLSEDWIKQFEQQNPQKRQILSIRRIVAKTGASEKLKTGDLIININGKIVTSFREVEEATLSQDTVDLLVLRSQKELQVSVPTTILSGEGTTKVLNWAGALLQNTHRAVAQLGFVYNGVYCSRWHYGSPAHRFSLRAVHWIVEVNGKPTPDLDAFINVVKEFKNRDSVRLKLIGLQDKVQVITIKLDYHYWPTWILERAEDGRWQYTTLSS